MLSYPAIIWKARAHLKLRDFSKLGNLFDFGEILHILILADQLSFSSWSLVALSKEILLGALAILYTITNVHSSFCQNLIEEGTESCCFVCPVPIPTSQMEDKEDGSESHFLYQVVDFAPAHFITPSH